MLNLTPTTPKQQQQQPLIGNKTVNQSIVAKIEDDIIEIDQYYPASLPVVSCHHHQKLCLQLPALLLNAAPSW
jgi:hypothetical protein